jgi:hypothetical protein
LGVKQPGHQAHHSPSFSAGVKNGGATSPLPHTSFYLMYGVKQRCDLEITKDCVWVEIPVRGNFCLITGNNYFAPDFNAKILKTN